jgi:hypothetical protein
MQLYFSEAKEQSVLQQRIGCKHLLRKNRNDNTDLRLQQNLKVDRQNLSVPPSNPASKGY